MEIGKHQELFIAQYHLFYLDTDTLLDAGHLFFWGVYPLSKPLSAVQISEPTPWRAKISVPETYPRVTYLGGYCPCISQPVITPPLVQSPPWHLKSAVPPPPGD